MTTTNDAGTLREKIAEYVLGYYQTGQPDLDRRSADDITDDILAAVAESMLSEDVLEELNSAVELETINVHSGEFRVNADEMMNAALNMAGITESEE